MNSLSSLIKEGAKRLKASGITSAALDTRLLLSYVTAYSTEDLLIRQKESVNANIANQFFKLIARRAKHEPISYITGEKEFYGINFKVNKNVLIPRPDSETVIDLAKTYFPLTSILDLGTGSGCLILTLLSLLPNAQGTGVDISNTALLVARKNASILGLARRMRFIKQDFAKLELKAKFDLVISNPPYIATKDLSSLQEDVKDYEPHIALSGGKDGLDCYRTILSSLHKFLKPNGICIFEIGIRQEDAISAIASRYGFKLYQSKKDLSDTVRAIAIAFR